MDDTHTEHARMLGLVMRAKLNPDKTGTQRWETLNKLLQLVHSPSVELKILAAVNIPCFIPNFPDLEEQAINAVYDLCEDQASQVRIEGYKAISEISRVDSKLLKRNADVLLQLLQSDEPEEVAVVKEALIQHIAMGPSVTLGVLCDQLTPIGEELDEEEKTIRKRLQALVMDFFMEEGEGTIRGHLDSSASSASIFMESLAAVIPCLQLQLTRQLLVDLIPTLRSITANPAAGEPLLVALLDRAALELRQTKPPTLVFLELAQDLVVRHRCAPLKTLLRYYCATLTGKIALQRLPRPSKFWVVNGLADLVACCREPESKSDSEVVQHLWKVADASPILIETLKSLADHSRCGRSIGVYLNNCISRKETTGWTTTSTLEHVLLSLLESLDKLPTFDDKAELRRLTTLLMSKSTQPRASTSKVVPPAPIPAPPVLQQPKFRVNVLRPCAQLPPVVPRAHTLPGSGSVGHSREIRPPPLSNKRKSTGDIDEPPTRMSLLTRLQTSTPEPFKASAPVPQTAPQRPVQSRGFSIKGAAAMLSPVGATVNRNGHVSAAPLHQSVLAPVAVKTGPQSLLSRMQSSVDSGSSLKSPDQFGSAPNARHTKRQKRW